VSNLRRTLELKAGPVLVLVARLPKAVPFLAVLGLLLLGLLTTGPLAAAALVVVFAFLGLQLFFAWPVLDAPQRLLRVVVLALLLGAALTRF
jgi:hypothetical protein